MLNSSQFKWSILEDEKPSGKKKKPTNQQSVTQRKYLRLNVIFIAECKILHFISSVRKTTDIPVKVNIWCLTWKIRRKQWFHTFSLTSIQTESKYSRQKESNTATLIPSINPILLVRVTGNCATKSMQHVSKNMYHADRCNHYIKKSISSVWYANHCLYFHTERKGTQHDVLSCGDSVKSIFYYSHNKHCWGRETSLYIQGNTYSFWCKFK